MPSPAEEVIFALRTQGMSQKTIAAQMGCSQSTVSRILNKNFSAPVNNGGRPKITSPQDDRALRRITLCNRFKSTTGITRLCNETLISPVSRSTTYRRLRSCGFSSRIPCTKPLLSWNRTKTVYSLHESTRSGRWKTGGKSSSRMNRNSSWAMATKDRVFGGKSMKDTRRLAWSGLSSIQPPSWSGDACLLEEWAVCAFGLQTQRSTQRCTIDQLDAYLLPSVEKLFADDDFVFQHDLAPARCAHKTVKYLQEKGIDVLKWPSNSPDLNIIEFVWQKMKARVQQVQPRTLEELKAVVRDVWDSFSQKELEEMVEFMPRRIREIVAQKGDATKY